MYTLYFANEARPNFPEYQRDHWDLDSLALEILRVSELRDLAAHNPQVYYGTEQIGIYPVARRRRTRVPRTKDHVKHPGTETWRITGYDDFEITEIHYPGNPRTREVSCEWVRSI